MDKHNGYKENEVLNMLKKGNPVFMGAINGTIDGHAWVIDGCAKRVRAVNKVNDRTRKVVDTRNEYQTLVHCNFGWSGSCDGYYISDVFNLENGALHTDQTDSPGSSSGDTYYGWWKRIITFK